MALLIFDETSVLETVKKRYKQSKQVSTVDFERFGRFYKLFRNQQVKKNYQGLANLFVPEPYRVIAKKTAKLSNAIRFIKVMPESPNDIEGSKIGTHLLNFLRRKNNWQFLERSAIQESRIVGLSWMKCIWNLNKEEIDKPYKGFELSFDTADKVLINPSATMLNVFMGDLSWLLHEYKTPIEKLKLNPNYNKEKLVLLENKIGNTKGEQTPLSQARFSSDEKVRGYDDKVKEVNVIEYWGKYKIEEKEEKDYLIVIADNNFLLRFDENPYKKVLDNPIPFIPFVANVIGKELYPIGDIEPGESLFNELNDTRNQRMDTVTLNVDPAKEILRGAQINEQELIARKGWVIHSSIPNGIRFIPPDLQGVRAAIDEEKIIRSDIQQYSGVLDFQQGSEVSAGISIDTARGAIIAKGESDVLTIDELELLKNSLRMLYRIVLAFAQNFLDREFIMRIVENGAEQFFNISKESIQGNFDLDIEMKTLQDKTTEQQMKLLLFNQAKQVPGANIGKFFSDVLESFNDNINIQEYYQPPQAQEEKPRVSISLRGDLNPAEVDEIYKQTGGDPKAADPLFREEFRKHLGVETGEFQPSQEENGLPFNAQGL